MYIYTHRHILNETSISIFFPVQEVELKKKKKKRRQEKKRKDFFGLVRFVYDYCAFFSPAAAAAG